MNSTGVSGKKNILNTVVKLTLFSPIAEFGRVGDMNNMN